jgi:hypothetical protein
MSAQGSFALEGSSVTGSLLAASIEGSATPPPKRCPLSADAMERYPGPPASVTPSLDLEHQHVVEEFSKAVIRWNSGRAAPASREETLQFAQTWFGGRRPRRRSRNFSSDLLLGKNAALSPSPEAQTWTSSGMRV